jgi:hypothetical protein
VLENPVSLVSALHLQNTPFPTVSILGSSSKRRDAYHRSCDDISNQRVLGCGTTVRAVPADGDAVGAVRDEWWDSTVFTTSPTALISFNVPDLTTFYEYPATCIDAWMLEPFAACNNSTFGNFTVFSVDPARSVVSDPLYRSCQKYSTPIQSPGVCPGGYSMAEITAILSSAAGGNKTFCSASCCRRFGDFFSSNNFVIVT